MRTFKEFSGSFQWCFADVRMREQDSGFWYYFWKTVDRVVTRPLQLIVGSHYTFEEEEMASELEHSTSNFHFYRHGHSLPQLVPSFSI